jgi:hypothetical protein
VWVFYLAATPLNDLTKKLKDGSVQYSYPMCMDLFLFNLMGLKLVGFVHLPTLGSLID